MKVIRLFFLIFCYIVLFTGCAMNLENNSSFAGTAQDTLDTKMAQDIDKNLSTKNCRLDAEDKQLLVRSEDGYKPYTYDKFPQIPEKLVQIISLLSGDDNNIELEYNDDKLYLYYLLEESKSHIIGGNDVDIFNFSIDRGQDIISFSIESLIFNEELDYDYSPLLLEIFNILFGADGGDIFGYFMKFYEHPAEGVTDETLINGMRVTYKCTPKHKLAFYLVADK